MMDDKRVIQNQPRRGGKTTGVNKALAQEVVELRAEIARLKAENDKVIGYSCMVYATIHELLTMEALRTEETDKILTHLLSHMPDVVHKALIARIDAAVDGAH
jgi:hypothetical protein